MGRDLGFWFLDFVGRGCQVVGTPIGVTDAGGQFDFEAEMQFAPTVMEDLFKN